MIRAWKVPYLAFSLVNLFKPENTSQFKLKKYSNSIKMDDILINTKIPVTLYSKILIFRDSKKSFNLGGDLSKTLTNHILIVTPSIPQYQELSYEFGKEMKINIKQVRRKSSREKSLMKLLKSAAIMASGFSLLFFQKNPNEFCDGLKILFTNKRTDYSRYANGNKLKLFNLGPIALFSNFRLITSSGKHLEGISHPHIFPLVYKLLTSSRGSDDLSNGFDQDRDRRQQ